MRQHLLYINCFNSKKKDESFALINWCLLKLKELQAAPTPFLLRNGLSSCRDAYTVSCSNSCNIPKHDVCNSRFVSCLLNGDKNDKYLKGI